MIFQLENKQVFSKSMLWKLQRQYFEKTGSDAWRLGEVPHYVTSNPRIANSYAETIFGFYKDSMQNNPGNAHAPIYILEAGAGSGRFCYYLLKRLHWLCDLEKIPHKTFCYVLSDFTQQNLNFWKTHPCFKAFIDEGILDIALFDLAQEQDILLQLSGKRISANSLAKPLILIANYVFDSIPQELFYTENGNCHLCEISLESTSDPYQLSASGLLKEISVSFEPSIEKKFSYRENWLQELLATYLREIEKGYFFFPETAIRSLALLRSFSETGLLVLTADKGAHQLENIIFTTAPQIVKHGSFSLTVNYHAFSLFAAQSGGNAFFPDHQYASINVGLIALVDTIENWPNGLIAFRKNIEEAGPDDYFTICQHLVHTTEKMPLKAILSLLRFSLYDSHMLSLCIPRLHDITGEIRDQEKEDLINTTAKCFENYFPLGESSDLAYRIACFFYEIDIFEWAVYYFKMSVDLYGSDPATLFNIAASLEQLGELENAKIILDIVLLKDPGHTAASLLAKEINNQKINTITP